MSYQQINMDGWMDGIIVDTNRIYATYILFTCHVLVFYCFSIAFQMMEPLVRLKPREKITHWKVCYLASLYHARVNIYLAV